jgi:hypothetical protein
MPLKLSCLHCHAHALKIPQLEEFFHLPICCYKVTVIVNVRSSIKPLLAIKCFIAAINAQM